MPQYRTGRIRTEKHKILTGGTVRTTLPVTTASRTRGTSRRSFAGAIMYTHESSTINFTAKIEITNGTTAYTLDQTKIYAGNSAVWSEEEYGVELEDDQYVQVSIPSITSFSSADDVLYVFLRLRDVG